MGFDSLKVGDAVAALLHFKTFVVFNNPESDNAYNLSHDLPEAINPELIRPS
jgi:hypothetical protein